MYVSFKGISKVIKSDLDMFSYLSICRFLSVCVSVCLSICMSICRSVYLCYAVPITDHSFLMALVVWQRCVTIATGKFKLPRVEARDKDDHIETKRDRDRGKYCQRNLQQERETTNECRKTEGVVERYSRNRRQSKILKGVEKQEIWRGRQRTSRHKHIDKKQIE